MPGSSATQVDEQPQSSLPSTVLNASRSVSDVSTVRDEEAAALLSGSNPYSEESGDSGLDNPQSSRSSGQPKHSFIVTAPVLDPEAASSETDRAMEDDNSYVAVCWGCGQYVSLPNYASVFRCGHCGALTYDYDKSASVGIHATPDPKRKRRRAFIKFRDCITVGFVLLLITVVITGGGVWSAFPILFPSPSLPLLLHSTIVLLLVSNTIFNLLCCSLTKAGPVSPLLYGELGIVPADSLNDCTLCTQCCPPKPKPPRAHHCSQCDDCVLDMDHHCPFIGNCVGRSNQRHFMVFLVWACSSTLYAACMTFLAMLQLFKTLDFSSATKVLFDFGSSASVGSFFLMIGKLITELLFSLNFRGVVLVYVFGIALGTAPCTAILLWQQLSGVFQGLTYIDSLKQIKAKGGNSPLQRGEELGDWTDQKYGGKRGGSGVWSQRMLLLRGVFGSGPVWTWVLPRVNPPPGSKAYQQRKQ